MKKILFSLFIICVSLAALAQQSFIEQSLIINVEVPVRVFKGNAFVEDLTIKDFELFEGGIPQKIEAVYLVKKRNIERSEETKSFRPETSRAFFLFFEISEYTAKIGESLDFFLHRVLLPGDELLVITPMKSYRLKENSLRVKPIAEIGNEVKGLLRKDTSTGNSEYRSAVKDLASLAKALAASLESGSLDAQNEQEVLPRALDSFTSSYAGLDLDELLFLYSGFLDKLEILRKVDQLKLLDLAKFLGGRPGQKFVFLFHQKEYIPQIEPRILNQFVNLYQDRPDVLQTVTKIFDFFKRDIPFHVTPVAQAYADSSVSIHFLYITRPAETTFGVRMEEHSEDIFSAFREMAQSTGGFFESSANPVSLFKQALEASENYYLLYYSPLDYTSDGKYRKIEVRVKSGDYRVLHRNGYFSN